MHLQTSLTNQSVWRALAAKPTLGQQITRLTIKQTAEDLQDRPVPDDVIPEALEAALGAQASSPVPNVGSSASIEEQLAQAVSAEEDLLEAMQGMSQLREFQWSTHREFPTRIPAAVTAFPHRPHSNMQHFLTAPLCSTHPVAPCARFQKRHGRLADTLSSVSIYFGEVDGTRCSRVSRATGAG